MSLNCSEFIFAPWKLFLGQQWLSSREKALPCAPPGTLGVCRQEVPPGPSHFLAWAPPGVAVIETLVSWRWTLNQSVCSFVCLFMSSCRLSGFERPKFQSSHTSSGRLLHWRAPPSYHLAHPGQCTGEKKPWVKLRPSPPWLWLPTLPNYGPHALDPMLPFLQRVQDQLQSEALSAITLLHLLSGISRAGIRSCWLP